MILPATMNPRISFVVSFLLTAVSAVIGFGDDKVRFSYNGSNGPQHWGNLSPSFATCSTGKIQSPIDIMTNNTVESKRCTTLDRDYDTANATITNSGIVLGVQFTGKSGALTIDGKKYWLKQMHWHTPSEHLINGQRFAAEFHLVHETDQKNIAVVSILYRQGKKNPLIARIEDHINQLGREKNCEADSPVYQQIYFGNFTTSYFKRNTRSYYKYVGSLTTPPCTENVTFYVISEVREMSQEQIETMKSVLCSDCKDNARPPQSLNGRKVELCHEHGMRHKS